MNLKTEDVRLEALHHYDLDLEEVEGAFADFVRLPMPLD
jgi:hypothetical protein